MLISVILKSPEIASQNCWQIRPQRKDEIPERDRPAIPLWRSGKETPVPDARFFVKVALGLFLDFRSGEPPMLYQENQRAHPESEKKNRPKLRRR